MSEALQALIASYTAELEYYRIGGGETSLQRAYELGRQAITAGMGLLDMAAVHHQALLTILLGIPTLDGPGLYQALQRSQPAFCQRLIFLTGDTLSPETRAFLEQTGIPTVHKPFTLDEVREVVQRVAAARQW
jgi:DNA-binding NarL/FixJ family response regulator